MCQAMLKGSPCQRRAVTAAAAAAAATACMPTVTGMIRAGFILTRSTWADSTHAVHTVHMLRQGKLSLVVYICMTCVQIS